MSSKIEETVRKSRLSLSLKSSDTIKNNEAIETIDNNEKDNNEKLNKSSACSESVVTSSNNTTISNNEDKEEEIILCSPRSQIEDKLIFSQKSASSNCDEPKVSIAPEQKKEISSSAETYFSGCSLEQVKDSSITEDEVNSIQDNNNIETFNSTEAKVFQILNETKNSGRIDNLSKTTKDNSSDIDSSLEIDVCTNFDEETNNVQEECNEIPNSPEAKIFTILKANEESKCCEKKYNELPPIIKRNVIIADSDEEFEEFSHKKRKLQKKVENTIPLNSQKENSTNKEPAKVSSSSCKEKSKVLKKLRDKSNVSKTSKEKSKNLPLKRKLECTSENSDDEFEKPDKRAKKGQNPQRDSMDKEVKRSKKLKMNRKSTTLSTENS